MGKNASIHVCDSVLIFFKASYQTLPYDMCGILVPQPGIEPMSPAAEAES